MKRAGRGPSEEGRRGPDPEGRRDQDTWKGLPRRGEFPEGKTTYRVRSGWPGGFLIPPVSQPVTRDDEFNGWIEWPTSPPASVPPRRCESSASSGSRPRP